jgi:hypothetical protein
MLFLLCIWLFYVTVSSTVVYDIQHLAPMSVAQTIQCPETVAASFEECHAIFLKGLVKIVRTFSWDSLFPGRDLNPGPHRYEICLLATGTCCLVRGCYYMVRCWDW